MTRGRARVHVGATQRERDATRMREYRQRVKSGAPIGAPSSAFVIPTDVVPWSTDKTTEVESAWQVAFRKAMAGWLLGQRSEHTRRAYWQSWQAWARWCAEVGEDPVEPGPGVAGAWMASMEAAGLSSSTRKVRRIAVRAALITFTLEGVRMGGDPFARVRSPKVTDQSTTIALTDEEMATLAATAAGMPGPVESAFLLCAIVGLRSIEAGQVCDDVLSMSRWGTVATVVRKGGGSAVVPIPDRVLRAAERGGWPHKPGAGTASNAKRIEWQCRLLTRECGVRVYPHQLRHWHATVALANGVELHKVQDSLGHADPRTTQRYNRGRELVQDHSAWTVLGLLAEAPVPCTVGEAGS